MHSERDEIVSREREFHNLRFSQEEDPRGSLDKWYRTIRHGAERQDEQIKRLSKNAIAWEGMRGARCAWRDVSRNSAAVVTLGPPLRWTIS